MKCCFFSIATMIISKYCKAILGQQFVCASNIFKPFAPCHVAYSLKEIVQKQEKQRTTSVTNERCRCTKSSINHPTRTGRCVPVRSMINHPYTLGARLIYHLLISYAYSYVNHRTPPRVSEKYAGWFLDHPT